MIRFMAGGVLVMNGWFKFHRKIFDNPVCNKDSEYFYVWCWILANAKYEDGERELFQNEDFVLQKGQLITTAKKISEKLNVNESKVNRILKKLENEKQIERRSTTKNTLISVVNWEQYQSDEKQNDKQVKNKWKTNEKQMTDEQQTGEEQMTNERKTDGKPSYYIKKERIEECKNDKECKENNNITVSNDTVCQTDVRQITEEWNKLSKYGIKQISSLNSSSQRYERLGARIKQYGKDSVLTAIEKIKQSDYLQGKSRNGWAITFDWFVRPNNFPKVLDGNYDNQNGGLLNGQSNRTVKMYNDRIVPGQSYSENEPLFPE